MLDKLFPELARLPCPVHTSPSDGLPLAPQEIRFLVNGKLWYRLAGPERHEDGRANRAHALGRREYRRLAPSRLHFRS